MTAFALLNGGRAVAYFPQLILVYRDQRGATSVSLVTWTLFAAANAATVCYALAVSDDRIMAIVFSLNAIGCLAIVGLTAFKRIYSERRGAMLWHWIESLRQSQISLRVMYQQKSGRHIAAKTHLREHGIAMI